MSSTGRSFRTSPTRGRRWLFAGLVALALLVTPALGVAASASAQSTYGGSSYGTATYSTEEDPGVTAPNTGFQAVARAAEEQPALFWGSAAALAAALISGGLVTRGIVKRKQEN